MKKLLSAILILLFINTDVYASLKLDDLNSPKDAVYRLGTTDVPEIKTDLNIQPAIQPAIQKEVTVNYLN